MRTSRIRPRSGTGPGEPEGSPDGCERSSAAEFLFEANLGSFFARVLHMRSGSGPSPRPHAHSKRTKSVKGKDDVNQLIASLEDAKTSIEEARVEEEEQQRDVLLDDAVTAIENVTDELEEGGTRRKRHHR